MQAPPPPPGFFVDQPASPFGDRPVYRQRPPQPSPRYPDEAEGSQISNQSRRVGMADTAFDNEQSLRNAFQALPQAKQFTDAATALGGALSAPDDAQGDLSVIYAFAKTMDPGSVVREGEMDMANQTASLAERLKVQYGMIGEGKRLPPNVRRGLLEAARKKVAALNQSYSQAYQHYRGLAKQKGFDPELVTGPHAGDAIRPIEESYIRAAGGTPRSRSQPAPPKQPVGAGDIGFEYEPPSDAMTPEQEAAYNAWFRANPKGTAEQLSQFSASIGAPVGNAQEIIEAFKKSGKFVPGSEALWQKPDLSNIRKGNEVVDPIARGVADVATLGLSEEIAAGFDTLANDKPYGANLDFHNAVRDYDTENNFGLRLGGQLSGGLILPSGNAGNIRGLARTGAAYGGAYGFGSADGGPVQRVPNALLGASAGGALGATLGAVSPLAVRGGAAIGRRFAGPSDQRQNALLQAGTEEGVPLNMSDLYPGARNTVATLETIPGASGPIRAGIEAGRDAMEGRVQQLGRGGAARENMGEAAQEAGERFVERSGRQADRLYTRARRMADGVQITPQATMQAISQLVRQEAQTPGGTRAGAVIRQYADAFESGGPITIEGARAMRSELLARLRQDGGLSRKQATRITGQIMAGVNQDIERSLAQAGRGGAAEAYRFADQFYAQRMDEIEDVVERFIGNENNRKSPEQTLQIMRQMAQPKGDSRRLTRMLSHLSPDERRDFAATLVEPLGRRSAEEPFSPATFIQNVRNLSPAARRIIFGTDGERSIQNLVRLANAKRDTVNRLNNSRSGQVSNYRAVLSSIVFGIPGGGALLGAAQGLNFSTGAIGGAAIAGAGMAGSRAIARALMNENFTRLLAQAPGTANPRAINAHIGRLRQLGAKDPNVRAVVESLEQQLIRAANDNLGRSGQVAASPNERPGQ